MATNTQPMSEEGQESCKSSESEVETVSVSAKRNKKASTPKFKGTKKSPSKKRKPVLATVRSVYYITL